jgi:hypothetical protein
MKNVHCPTVECVVPTGHARFAHFCQSAGVMGPPEKALKYHGSQAEQRYVVNGRPANLFFITVADRIPSQPGPGAKNGLVHYLL